MAGAIQLSVVTPERALLEESVDEVVLPGLNGYMGVLPGHAPLFSELATGVVSYKQGGTTRSLSLAGGFVEVIDNQVRVLADVAELASSIDVERARRARARAAERIESRDPDVDYDRARQALQRAETRLSVASVR
jgi:F-type H+-transporting ATPase subunit epsilon